jgi:hypothetical protein
MKTIKSICRGLIGPKNYKDDTKLLAEAVYSAYGVKLEKVNGIDLLHGSPTVPKLMSVLRRIQSTKKEVARRVKKAELEKDAS